MQYGVTQLQIRPRSNTAEPILTFSSPPVRPQCQVFLSRWIKSYRSVDLRAIHLNFHLCLLKIYAYECEFASEMHSYRATERSQHAGAVKKNGRLEWTMYKQAKLTGGLTALAESITKSQAATQCQKCTSRC